MTRIIEFGRDSYNPGHILELHNILVQIRYTITKAKLDIQYSKRGARVVSRVTKPPKTLGN